ncbi:MAG: hypothetical protein AAGJ40_09325 [Planctomycetota bacterium]
MSNQPDFRFPGITGIISASTTLTKGIAPAVTSLVVRPDQFEMTQRVGTAEWYYNNVLVHSLPFTAIDKVRSVNSNGTISYQLTLLDRRWGWQFPIISGTYNVSKKGVVIPERMKTPRELAILCLDAMGEANYDVSLLPNDDRPFIQWDLDNAAKALASLCELYNCEINLQVDNSVRVVQKGAGNYLPPPRYNTNIARLTYEKILDPIEFPQFLRVVTDPVRWQVDLLLEAVGYEDEFSDPMPIDELSYAPWKIPDPDLTANPDAVKVYTDTWEGLDPNDDFEWIDDDDKRELARKHIFRTFRVTIDRIKTDPAPADPLPANYELPANNFLQSALTPLTDVKQILPLISEQVETTGEGEREQPKEPIVWGLFDHGEVSYPTDDDEANKARLEEDGFLSKYIYYGSISVDEENGLVTLGDYMTRLPKEVKTTDTNDDDVENETAAQTATRIEERRPLLWLRCSINLRELETLAPQRYFRQVTIDSTSPAGVEYEIRKDIEPTLYRTIDTAAGATEAEWVTNAPAVYEQCDFYLQQAIKRYITEDAESARYAGIQAINLDGAIQQATYSIDQSGLGTTNVDRHTETSFESLGYDELKTRRKIAEAVKARDEAKRLAKIDERRQEREQRRPKRHQ